MGDWAGASIDGGESHSSYRLRYRLRDEDGVDLARKEGVTVRSGVFALGSVVYFMVMGEEVWVELEEPEGDKEVVRMIAAQEWPDVEGVVRGDVVRGCWEGRYRSTEEVGRAV